MRPPILGILLLSEKPKISPSHFTESDKVLGTFREEHTHIILQRVGNDCVQGIHCEFDAVQVRLHLWCC
jgi:hypothetical protein